MKTTYPFDQMEAIEFIKSIKHLLVGAHSANADKVIYDYSDEGTIKGMVSRLPEPDTCLYMGLDLSKGNLTSYEWSKVYSEIVRALNSRAYDGHLEGSRAYDAHLEAEKLASNQNS